MASAPPSVDLNLQSSYGLLLIGCFLSSAVWGVTVVQTILYSFMYTKDPLKLRLLVRHHHGMAIDTANQVLVLKSVWPALILHWGQVEILAKSEGTLYVHHVWVAAIVGLGVQSYYVWRIYVLSRRRLIFPCLLMILVAWQITYYFLVFGKVTVSAGKQSEQLTAVAISLRASGAGVDVLIAAAMVYLLLRPRNRHMFDRTQTLVYRLLVLSVNTGAWTAVLAIFDFVCIWAFPTFFTFTVFELPICSLYLSTLLVNLNARKFLTDVDGTVNLSDISISGNSGRQLPAIHFAQRPPPSTERTRAHVHTTISGPFQHDYDDAADKMPPSLTSDQDMHATDLGIPMNTGKGPDPDAV
ncbi:hypothetical protein GGX14DRAFT_441161 [Mycena pura]|uniref:DUF6534 domain-containing protein n=1 Tax=Mycena pura TaxID=153505 RepID=A0AAD6VPU3_9AGAR|nr:hypothetical protein GGX14DRAFT_441161 [Mycena pura]